MGQTKIAQTCDCPEHQVVAAAIAKEKYHSTGASPGKCQFAASWGHPKNAFQTLQKKVTIQINKMQSLLKMK
nr:hypothetical protein Iba_chr07cCG8210 [Ipomoea batatas]